jgi:DNA invertase Pin-like site-specific DNA recombinase
MFKDMDSNGSAGGKDGRGCFDLPQEGVASAALRDQAHGWWLAAARASGVDLTGFVAGATVAERVAWAVQGGLQIAAGYSRYSTKRQHSTEDQVRVLVEFAARNRMYLPPELLCVDEGKKGRKSDRDGVNRLRLVFHRRLAGVLLLFKLSRLFRQMHQAVKFIQEDLVEEGFRAVAVSQAIDTANEKAWRLQVALHGVMDEELLNAIADHVREGLIGLFLKGFTTGALPVGYYPKEVPGAPRTRRGLPRTMPAVEPRAAELIRQHYAWIADGGDITACWMRWRADNGPVDPRSDTREMSYEAYHRMLSRPAYLGVFEFCRKRNCWLSKRDTIEQRPQPTAEVKVMRCEELRIVSDELYYRVQARLDARKTGPRQPRDPGSREYHLWDLAIGLFRCPHCGGRRFHMTGAGGRYMHCPRPECPAPAMVNRRDAVEAVCKALSARLSADTGLVDLVMSSFELLDDQDVEELDRQIQAAERRVQSLTRKMAGLEKLLGEGTDNDDHRREAEIRGAQAERNQEQLKLAGLQRRRGGGHDEPVTRAQVEQALKDVCTLLDAAARGALGRDVVRKAYDVFAQLVGNQVLVYAERRPGRQRWLVRGRFKPDLVGVLRGEVGARGSAVTASSSAAVADVQEVEVWLREPPRIDRIADEVHHLYEVEGLGFRLISQRLETKYGEKIGSGNCCAAWRRWYEVRKLPLPPPRGNMGRPRKRAG